MKFLFALIASIFFSLTAFSQDFTNAQMKEGLISLKSDIKTYNPGLNDFNSNFDEKANEIIASIDKEFYNIIEHFKLITQMCALSNEGHFAIGSWSDKPHKGFKENSYQYLPLNVKILGNKIYVWNDFSNENQLTQGDEVLSINGKSSQEIINQLIRYTESDGKIVGYAHRLIESGFNWRYYLYMDNPDTFDINYKKISSETVNSTKILAITNKEIITNYKSRHPKREKSIASISDVYELNFDGEIAVLKLKSFNRSKIEKYNLKSDKLYKEVFQSLADENVSTLIVDLRDNSGGKKEFANDIVPYILQDSNDDPFLRKSISWNGKEKILKLPKKHNLNFKGKVITIVNNGTFSAASSLARFLKEYANAILVGQETGTRYEGFVAGSKQYVSIPHSDIEIGIPRYLTIFPKSRKQELVNRGLIPDHIIQYTITDLIEKQDLELEFVKINLLNK